ncbi:hypothetical protein [uncultured Bradyrhizobium sp.]|uniref:hypothetical protein n=1 Tax=uncultured Bradyrhizobium sp. TaxID=199684 RepID=UPI0035CC4447
MGQASVIWKFIGSEKNRKILSWAGGGIAVIIGGLFAWYTSTHSPAKDLSRESINVGAGGVGINGSVTNSPVTTNVTSPK